MNVEHAPRKVKKNSQGSSLIIETSINGIAVNDVNEVAAN